MCIRDGFTVDLSEGKATDQGWALFNDKGCTACHGPKGNGVLAELPGGEIVSVGAANLTDAIWRFEPGGLESAKHTILYGVNPVSYTHLRAHETVLDLVCRLLLEKKKTHSY